MANFADKLTEENKRIKIVVESPALTVKKNLTDEQKAELEKKRKARWNSNNLIPSISEDYDESVSREYSSMLLCYDAANQDPALTKKMYKKWSLLDVYETLMLRRAYNW